MMARLTLQVNGAARVVDVDDPNTPLLYVLRNDLELTGAKFGCGLAQCGACTVHVDGQAVRSCAMPVSAVVGRPITTIEGLGSPERPDPVQAAFIAEQAPQCGYCTAGLVMTARAFLQQNRRRRPSRRSSRRWPGTSAAAGATSAWCARCSARPPRWEGRDMTPITRRAFLGAGGVLAVGFGLGGRAPRRAAAQAAVPAAGAAWPADRYLGKTVAPDQVDAFLAIHADDTVTLFTGRVDLGHGASRGDAPDGRRGAGRAHRADHRDDRGGHGASARTRAGPAAAPGSPGAARRCGARGRPPARRCSPSRPSGSAAPSPTSRPPTAWSARRAAAPASATAS